MNRERIIRNLFASSYVVASSLLAAALWIGSASGEGPLLFERKLSIALGLVLGLVNLGAGLMVVVFLSPLLDIYARLASANGISLVEHILVPLLFCGIPLVWRTRYDLRVKSIELPLAVFCLLAVASGVTGLWQYTFLPVPPWDLLVRFASRHFRFEMTDVGTAPFWLVHGCMVIVEGALFYLLLTTPRLGLRAAALRGAVTFSTIALAVAGVAQVLKPVGVPEFFLDVQPGLLRITSTLPDPNTLGIFLVLTGPISVVAAWQSRGGRTAGLAVLALVGFCLVQSVSRSAWIGAAGSALALAVLVAWRSKALGLAVGEGSAQLLRRVIVAGAALGALAVVLFSAGVAGREISQRNARSPLDMLVFSLDVSRPANDLLPARIDHWTAAIEIWKDFPLFGAGVGKYTPLKKRYLPDRDLPGFTDAHNYYMKTLAELGLTGLAAFLVVLGGVAATLRSAWPRNDSPLQARLAAIGVGLLGFALGSLAQDPLNLGTMQRAFWAMVALLVLETRSSRERRTSTCTDIDSSTVTL
jgi:O-antigen ligase